MYRRGRLLLDDVLRRSRYVVMRYMFYFSRKPHSPEAPRRSIRNPTFEAGSFFEARKAAHISADDEETLAHFVEIECLDGPGHRELWEREGDGWKRIEHGAAYPFIQSGLMRSQK